MADRTILLGEDPATTSTGISLRHRPNNLGFALVRGAHPRGLSTTCKALAGPSVVGRRSVSSLVGTIVAKLDSKPPAEEAKRPKRVDFRREKPMIDLPIEEPLGSFRLEIAGDWTVEGFQSLLSTINEAYKTIAPLMILWELIREEERRNSSLAGCGKTDAAT
jgi:hypothetical protein